MPAVKNGNLLALLRLDVFLIYQNDQDIHLYVYYTNILMLIYPHLEILMQIVQVKKLNLNNPLINFHKFLSWQLYDPHVLMLTLCDLGRVRRSHRSVSFPFSPTNSGSGIQHRWSNQGPESISNTTYGGFAEIRCNR